ncbi:MAG: hypothetical protein JRJ13_15180 [Deltaproteobacteria bacterium]|nr:hypothetical protein [Deltaproteobacteria bacterium]
MDPWTFSIKSIPVQNTIMLLSLGVVLCFLIWAFIKKSPKHVIVSLFWLLTVLWFFNSPFFGFSRVIVNPTGIKIEYGILSLKNTTVPLETPWKIESHFSGIKKMRKVYTLKIGTHESMRVKSRDKYELLKRIGETIDKLKGRGTNTREKVTS